MSYIYPAKGLLIGDTIFTTLRWTETDMTDKYKHKHKYFSEGLRLNVLFQEDAKV